MAPSPPRIPTRLADLADPPPDRPAPAFDVFLAASELDDAGAPAFQERSDRFSPSPGAVHPLAESAAPVALARHPVAGDDVLAARHSGRRFDGRPLSPRALEELLGALAPAEPGRRTWPSAGGLAAVQVHVVGRRVAEPFGARVHRYRFDHHGLAPVGPVPPDPDLARMFFIAEDLPPVLVVLGLLSDETTIKYGERGGRFALIEVGAAAQTLSLRMATLGLSGYLLGGLLDHEVTELVGAAGTSYRPILALAVGPGPIEVRP